MLQCKKFGAVKGKTNWRGQKLKEEISTGSKKEDLTGNATDIRNFYTLEIR